jgi:hypothetical protein
MILAAQPWPSNAEMIYDVASLGYLDGYVLDPTYGLGTFWRQWVPERFEYSDIKLDGSHHADFTDLPWVSKTFDAVVYDPPYKLNGTPSEPDVRYGVDVVATWQERMGLCEQGALECWRVLKPGGYLLWKCMDQVCSGKVRWQTYEFTNFMVRGGLFCELVDRFDFLMTPRTQPVGRRQVHAARNYSTLLVFKKER